MISGDSPAVLLVDDEWPSIRPLLANLTSTMRVIVEARSDQVSRHLAADPGIGAVLLDLRFDGQAMQGEEVLRNIRRTYPQVPVIVLTALRDVALALRLVHEERSAHYFFAKDQVDPEQLCKAVENAVEHYRLAFGKLRMTDRGPIIGSSAAFERVLRLAAAAAASHRPVLIAGETGTGKELIARAIHLTGPNHAGPFVSVHCGAMPGDLAEVDLLGPPKPTPPRTGSPRSLIDRARGGTLFLEEIQELPESLQARLAQQLAREEDSHRDGAQGRPLLPRVIVTTSAVEALRADQSSGNAIVQTLSAISIEIPPLRERPGDIPELARHFLATEFAGVHLNAAAVELLRSMPLPGNARELRSILRRAADASGNRDTLDSSALRAAASPSALGDTHALWVERILDGESRWSDLRAEFRGSSSALRVILDGVIRGWKSKHGERPSGRDLAELLEIKRNHLNQLLDQVDLRLRDYD